MVTPPTMTLHECAEAFRANQISISEATLAAGIEQGVFPFAVSVSGKKRTPLIFRARFYSWLKEMTMKEVMEV